MIFEVTFRQLNAAATGQSKSMEKLSSGLRINRAGDDAAGLAISEKMRAQIKGLDMASKNAQDGISLIQTAEGALNETHSILQRMRELATQAANDTNVTVDRNEIQKEMNQLTSEINRIGNTTEFNTQKLLNGGGVEKLTVDTTTAGEDLTGSVKGVYEVDLAGLSTGQTVTIDGETISFTNDIPDTIAVIKANTTLAAKYDITDAADKVTFTQKVGNDTALTITSTNTTVQGSFATVTAGATGTGGTQGVYTFDLDISTLKDGSVLKIDSTEYTFQSDGSGDFKDATELLAAIDATGTYTSAEAGGTITLTQVTGSSTSPTVTLDAKGANGFSANFQVGANEGQSMSVAIIDMRAAALKISGEAGAVAGNGVFTTDNTVTDGTNNTKNEAALDVSSHQNASAAITVINDAIEAVSAQRSELGAYQNRLEHTINNLGTSSENLTAAESRIRDVDYALAA